MTSWRDKICVCVYADWLCYFRTFWLSQSTEAEYSLLDFFPEALRMSGCYRNDNVQRNKPLKATMLKIFFKLTDCPNASFLSGSNTNRHVSSSCRMRPIFQYFIWGMQTFALDPIYGNGQLNIDLSWFSSDHVDMFTELVHGVWAVMSSDTHTLAFLQHSACVWYVWCIGHDYWHGRPRPAQRPDGGGLDRMGSWKRKKISTHFSEALEPPEYVLYTLYNNDN